MSPNSAEGQQRIANPLARGAIGQRGPLFFLVLFLLGKQKEKVRANGYMLPIVRPKQNCPYLTVKKQLYFKM